jgi:hypothetical protein
MLVWVVLAVMVVAAVIFRKLFRKNKQQSFKEIDHDFDCRICCRFRTITAGTL